LSRVLFPPTGSRWLRPGLAGLLLILLMLPIGTMAQDPRPDNETLQALIQALEDPEIRAGLLKALRERTGEPANGGANEGTVETPPAADPETVTLPRQVAQFTQQAAEGTVAELRRQGALLGEVAAGLQEMDWAAFARVALDLILLMAVTVGIFWLLRRSVRSLYGALDRWALGSTRTIALFRTVPAVILAAAIDLLVVLLAWLVGYGLALFVLSGTATMATQHALFLNAFLLIEVIKAVLRLLFANRYAGLRLVPLTGEEAAYWNAWLARLVGFIGYGLLFLVPVVHHHIAPAAGRSMTLLVLLVAFSYALAIILQNRVRVRDRLNAWGDRSTVPVIRLLMTALAQSWHWLAILYLTALTVVSLVRPEDALPFMMLATGQTLFVILIGLLVGALLTQIIKRQVHIPAETRRKYPLLEERLNAYIPTVLKVVRLVILAVVLALILDAWNLFNLGSWLRSEPGIQLVTTLISVAMILVLALLLWLGVATWIEHQLNPENGLAETPARRRTLLTILRNAVAIALTVMVTMMVLAELGINIGPLLAGAGVLGLAIGFGSQKLVQDIITGVFIQLENAINTGDVVQVAGITGVAERLTIRSIGLRDLSGIYHLIPFSSVDSVSNHTRGFSYHLGEYGVAYRENTDEVIVCLREAFAELRNHPEHGPKILEDLEVHGVTAFADSAVQVRVRIKTLPGAHWAVGREYNRLVKRHFDAAGIEIPFPHLTLYFGQDKDGTAPPGHLQILTPPALPETGAHRDSEVGTAPRDPRSRANPKPKGDFDED